LAAQILALSDEELAKRVFEFKGNLKTKIVQANKDLQELKFEYRVN